jgi:hypothetical protein
MKRLAIYLTGKDFPKKAAIDEANRAHERHHGIE